MTKNKLYIDCQFFQTPAWDRGMGRYTMSLLEALYKMSHQTTEFIIIFSTNLPKKAATVDAIKSVCPDVQFADLNLSTAGKNDYSKAAERNKDILNSYLRTQTDTESRRIFMIPCLFQEPTASIFPDGVEKCLLYYDAIPLLYYQRYRDAINYNNYLERHHALYEADRIFTISRTIADDLAVYYGMKCDNNHVINIDGACIEGMLDKPTKPKLNIPKKYILLPTSDDIRKNNRAAILAFDQLRTLTGTDYQLIITSQFDPARQKQLEHLAEGVVFTGNVDDNELAWLYEHAEVVLFTSEYEGLGLPILEAVRMGKKVVCSNIPVFREISEKAFYFFDPLDIADITHKLYKALQDDGWEVKEKLYQKINTHYTWHRTASLMHDTLKKTAPNRQQEKKPRIAVLAPAPDGYSAIGKVVQELHEVMARYFDVEYYFENRKEKPPINIRPNYLEYLAPCYDIEEFNAQRYKTYDKIIYHIGNSEYHFRTILNALHLPGIAICHDTVLREAFGEMVRLGYMREPRLLAEARLDELTATDTTAFITSLINNQLACVVHSNYADKALSAVAIEDVIIKRAQLPIAMPMQSVQSQHRTSVHIGLAGILSGRKGLDVIKELAQDASLGEAVILHVFGFSMVDPEAIDELKNYKNVRLATDLSDLEYQMQLGNLDILVNFRTNYRGETSLTVLEAMRYGCVAIINRDLGWFDELPDDAVRKVTDYDELIKAVRQLVASRAEREKIGAAAKVYVSKVHDPEAYARLLRQLVDQKIDTSTAARAQIIKRAPDIGHILQQYNQIGEA